MLRGSDITVNDVVVVPDVQLGNLGVGCFERLLSIPAGIIVEVVVVTLGPHLFIEGELSALPWVGNVRPRLKGVSREFAKFSKFGKHTLSGPSTRTLSL